MSDQKTCAVTITVHEGPIAVFPNGLDTRVEMHTGDTATFEGARIVVEPALLHWRAPATEAA